MKPDFKMASELVSSLTYEEKQDVLAMHGSGEPDDPKQAALVHDRLYYRYLEDVAATLLGEVSADEMSSATALNRAQALSAAHPCADFFPEHLQEVVAGAAVALAIEAAKGEDGSAGLTSLLRDRHPDRRGSGGRLNDEDIRQILDD